MKLLRVVLIIIAIGLLALFSFYGVRNIGRVSFLIQEARVYAYSKLSFMGSFVSGIKSRKSLIEENLKLKEENYSLLARFARQFEIEDQNNFFRQALGLPSSLLRLDIIEAGMFNSQFTPSGYYFSVNKGFDDSINKDDAVITSSGILLGVVEEVFKSQSLVSSVVNSDFKTTINILSKNISGITKGAMGNGLYLDFISQNDDIVEGDIVITSGTDILPSGLIIGKIIRIDSSGGNLFKNVIVKPSFQDMDISRVLIIKK